MGARGSGGRLSADRGMFVYRPAAAPPHAHRCADAQLFSDVYSMEQSTEPMAAAPIHELFEDNQ